jgi:hypothetical protein
VHCCHSTQFLESNSKDVFARLFPLTPKFLTSIATHLLFPTQPAVGDYAILEQGSYPPDEVICMLRLRALVIAGKGLPEGRMAREHP